MKNILVISLLYMLLSPAHGASAPEFATVKVAQILEFKAKSDLIVTERRPVNDFVLVRFCREETLLLTVYIGNHPKFPSSHALPARKRADIGGFHVMESAGKANGPSYKELLIDLAGEQYWPRYLHISISQGPRERLEEAERIIETLRYVPLPGTIRKNEFIPAPPNPDAKH